MHVERYFLLASHRPQRYAALISAPQIAMRAIDTITRRRFDAAAAAAEGQPPLIG